MGGRWTRPHFLVDGAAAIKILNPTGQFWAGKDWEEQQRQIGIGLVFIPFPPNMPALIRPHLIKFLMGGDNDNCPTPQKTELWRSKYSRGTSQPLFCFF